MTYTPEEVMALVKRVAPKRLALNPKGRVAEQDIGEVRGWNACRTAFLENVKRELGLPQ